jgi:hypothetical protein
LFEDDYRDSALELFKNSLINGLRNWEDKITKYYYDKYDDYSYYPYDDIFSYYDDEFVETLVDNITNADYGVEAQASGVDDWKKELTLLSNVTKGMDALKDIDKDSEDAADIIGSLLEAMDESSLITKSSSQNVANKILTDLLNDDNDHVVNKDDDKSWTETFEEILQA